MKTGIQNANGDVIIFMGGDGQDDPSEIKNLIEIEKVNLPSIVFNKNLL